MQYSICVAADCDGEKVNLRFLFDSYGPSVTQLLNRSTIAFNNVFKCRGIDRTFVSSSAVVFNNAHCTWEGLERSTQLLHNSQVYLFQPDVLDIPAEIPEPFEGLPLLGDNYCSPHREYSTSPRAVPPSYYAPRCPFTHRSPYVQTSIRRSASGGRASHRDYHSRNYHHRSQRNDERDRFDVHFTDDGYRSPSYGLVRSEKSPSYRGTIGRLTSSSSPPYRVVDESHYYRHHNSSRSSGGDRRSIIRDEREKIEQQFHMPLDEMRRSLKEETQEMNRSISPQRQVTY